jgi:hypothetical protein
VIDSCSQLRSATRRAKSDVANKLVSMFLHELSRKISQDWPIRVEDEQYEELVRERFRNQCPYCSCELKAGAAVVEHLDGMNRYRAGLHVAGNVLLACRKCNGEKRRDDSLRTLTLAPSGWESFLCHDGTRCPARCPTCSYWAGKWDNSQERALRLAQNLEAIRAFRAAFPEFGKTHPPLAESLPVVLTKLYSDCQAFAESEIRSLLDRVVMSQTHPSLSRGLIEMQ